MDHAPPQGLAAGGALGACRISWKAAELPREMTRADMDRLRDRLSRRRGAPRPAGFICAPDCTHGAWLPVTASFIRRSPNKRTDEQWRGPGNRLRSAGGVGRGARGVAGVKPRP